MIKTIAIASALLAGCGVGGHRLPAPAAPALACPAGEVVVVDEAPVGCDLRPGVNTLTLVVHSDGSDGGLRAAEQRLLDQGCRDITWANGATGTGHDCDF